MKTIALIFIFTCSSAFANGVLINCGTNSANVRIQEENGLISGHAYHIYTSANIICSDNIKDRLASKESFKCAGVYDYDTDNEDTLAQVAFKFEGEKLVADLKTTKLHGRKTIRLECDL